LKSIQDTPADKRLLRRIQRDTSSRKRMLSQVLQQHTTYAEPMYQKYVEPGKCQANIIVNGNQDMTAVKDVIVSYIRDKLGELTNGLSETDIYLKNNFEVMGETCLDHVSI